MEENRSTREERKGGQLISKTGTVVHADKIGLQRAATNERKIDEANLSAGKFLSIPVLRRIKMAFRFRWVLFFAPCLFAIAPLTPAAADDPAGDYTKIREGMSKLAPLVGKWHAVALFHDGDRVTENDGTYDIAWTLEDRARHG
jgi:hypothetical protein